MNTYIIATGPLLPSLGETYVNEFLLSNVFNIYGHSGCIASVQMASAIKSAICAFLVGPLAVSPSPPERRPAKRARTIPAKASNHTRLSPPRKVRGRLSELPTMPMDILFEVCNIRLVIFVTSEKKLAIVQIFSHLHPSDLLSVSRVNRAFRGVLLSRNSSCLWNACLRFCGAPPSPSDMAPPAWTHLLFGGAYCYVSGPLFNRTIHSQTQTSQSRVVAQRRSIESCFRCVAVRASLA